MPARACEYQDIRRAFCWPTSVPKTSWQHSAAVSAAPLIILLVQLHCWEVFTASQLRSFVRPKGRKSPSSAGNTSRRRPYLEPGVEGQMTSASSLSYGIRHAVGVTERETERERERLGILGGAGAQRSQSTLEVNAPAWQLVGLRDALELSCNLQDSRPEDKANRGKGRGFTGSRFARCFNSQIQGIICSTHSAHLTGGLHAQEAEPRCGPNARECADENLHHAAFSGRADRSRTLGGGLQR